MQSKFVKISRESVGDWDNLGDLKIPIELTQDIKDMGFYTPFDGLILQKDIVNNFTFEFDENNTLNVKVYNTSEQTKKFLKLSNYYIFWGDGTSEVFDSIFPDFKSHTYITEGNYTITLRQTNPWGDTVIQKKITLPSVENTSNIDDAVLTTPNGDEFVFDLDSFVPENNYDDFIISGYTTSKLNELSQYGQQKFIPGKMVKKYNEDYGIITEMNSEFTEYTVNNINYIDYKSGQTIFFVTSSGLTEDMVQDLPITKEQVLMGVVNSPEIQSAVFIDRGKQAGFESILRLGEVDNIGDLNSYGYGYFKLNKL